MRHPGPPGYVHPCFPRTPLPGPEAVLAALCEGMCPFGHTLEPLPSCDDRRAGACHGCCPCTRWEWLPGVPPGHGPYIRVRHHLADIPQGVHC
jgi:hypothetical protein